MALRFERFASAGFKDFVDVVELYRSSTGAVFCAKYKYDNCLYVLKERKVSELGKKKDVMNEVRLLTQLDHYNVIKCEGWFSDDDRQSLFIILEYCPGGDLSKKIELRMKSRRYFSEQYIWFLFHQICLGVQHLHVNGIIHRDLKTLNIMLTRKDTLIKIADLGVSRQVSRNTSMLDTFIGTPLYLSPELVDNKPYNEKTDIWSLGVILYELCALTVPFRAANVLTLANMIRAARYEPLPAVYSNHIEKCIPWLLNVNYLNRPTINQVIAYCEARLTDNYHGDDMASEYDSQQQSISKLVHQPKSSAAKVPLLPDDDRQREEQFEQEHNQFVLDKLRRKVRSDKSGQLLIASHQDEEQDVQDDDDDDVQSEDSLENGRQNKPSALLAAAREHSKKKHHKRRPINDGDQENDSSNKKQQGKPGDVKPSKPKSDEETMIQFELSRIQMLLRRELAQMRRLMKLKEFFDGSADTPEIPSSSGHGGINALPHANYSQLGPLPPTSANGQPINHNNVPNNGNNSKPDQETSNDNSSLKKKLKQNQERITILEKSVQNNGVMSRSNVNKIDALKVLISVQEITVLPPDEEIVVNGKQEDANAHPNRSKRPQNAILYNAYKDALKDSSQVEVERKHKGPIKYKKLVGRHRNEEQNFDDDHIDRQFGDPNDAYRLEQLRIHDDEGVGGGDIDIGRVRARNKRSNAANQRKIEVLKYANPFEAVGPEGKDAFKQKNLDYNLFVNEDEPQVGGVNVGVSAGNKQAKSTLTRKQYLEPVLGDTDSGGETESHDDHSIGSGATLKKVHSTRGVAGITEPATVVAVKTPVSASNKDISHQSSNQGVIQQQIEVTSKGDGTVVLTVKIPPILPVAAPVQVIGDSNQVSTKKKENKITPVHSIKELNNSNNIDNASVKSVSISEDIPSVIPPAILPEFIVRPPTPQPPVIPKCTLFNTQRDKVTGKIGNPVEETTTNASDKVYRRAKFGKKRVGSSFEDHDALNWQPGQPLARPSTAATGAGNALAPIPQSVNGPPYQDIPARPRTSSSRVAQAHVEQERQHINAGKRFNIISSTWE